VVCSAATTPAQVQIINNFIASECEKHPEFIGVMADMGAYYQINAGSILGAAGWNTKRFAKTMMKSGMVQFIATDAHDLENRCPSYGKAADWFVKKFGESEAEEYFYKNPKMILENQAI
jgi:protein-tyrosine phosphatase